VKGETSIAQNLKISGIIVAIIEWANFTQPLSPALVLARIAWAEKKLHEQPVPSFPNNHN